jgi:predicted dehydrogenase
MEKLRVGMIGAGGIARGAHFRALKQLRDAVQIVAVADVVQEAAENLANQLEAEFAFSNYQLLLDRQDIDAVLVTVPNFLHGSTAIDALEAGKHVLCEKPMALHGADAERMVLAQKRTGKTLMVALNNRFRRDIQFLKAQIEAGEFGEIYNAKCGWMRRAGIPGWGGWFTTMEKSGGGPLIDIGVHMLDVTLYLMGNPKPVSVVGSTYRKFGDQPEGKNRVWAVADPNGKFDVEDMATAFVKLDNGATLSLDVSWAANIERETCFVNLMGTRAGCSLENEEGMTIYTEKHGELLNIRPQVKFDGDEARVNMWQHFIDCVRNGKEPISSPEQGMFVNKILDALYESSRTGDQVKIKAAATEVEINK